MNGNSPTERQKQIEFAVGVAANDGRKPNVFTKNLLK